MLKRSHSIILIFISTILLSFGQILIKKGAVTASLNIYIFQNVSLIIGYVAYLLAGLTIVIALKYNDLSLLYPLIATSYIWVILLSMYFLQENISPLQLIGILGIILGVTFVGFGGKKSGN